MSSGQEPEKCCFDMWQQEDILPPNLQYPDAQTGPFFYLQFRINLVVRYLPHHYRMNVYSGRRTCPSFLDLLKKTSVSEIILRILSCMPVPAGDVEAITKQVGSKALMIASDVSNTGRVVIPVVMSLRVFWAVAYDQQVDISWASRLGVPLSECRNIPAMESSVEELDKVIYGADKGLCMFDLCFICLEEFSVGEKVTRMPCMHVYHVDCIVKWLKKNHLCPSCRFPLPVCQDTEAFCPFRTKRVFRKPRRRVCWRPACNSVYSTRRTDLV